MLYIICIFLVTWIAVAAAILWHNHKNGGFKTHSSDNIWDDGSSMIGGVDVTDFNSPDLP